MYPYMGIDGDVQVSVRREALDANVQPLEKQDKPKKTEKKIQMDVNTQTNEVCLARSNNQISRAPACPSR